MSTIVDGSSGLTFPNGTVQAAAASSAMTLISTKTANGTSSFIEWSGLSGYNNYLLILDNFYPDATNPTGFQVQLGNSSAYITSGYYFSVIYNRSNNATVSGDVGAAADRFSLSTGSTVASTNIAGLSSTIYLTGLINNQAKLSALSAVQAGGSTPSMNLIVQGYLGSTQTITKIKIFGDYGGDNGNILGGTASLYGISS